MNVNAFHFLKGRIALYAILKAMGIGPGDEVILQGFTCVAVPLPILHLRAEPIYVDIDLENYNIDLNKIEEHITERTKAIIAQHTYGIPLNMNKLLEIAQKHNLYIIEDCCHSFSSEYNGQRIGTFGDAAFYSYDWGKPIIVGTGGSAVINNINLRDAVEQLYFTFKPPPLIDDVRVLVQYWVHALVHRPALFWSTRVLYRLFSKLGITIGTFQKEEYEGQMADPERLMGKLSHGRFKEKIKKLEEDKAFRKRMISEYENKLVTVGIEPRKPGPQESICWLRYPLRTKNKDYVLNQARKRKIELGNWFTSPVHPLEENRWDRVHYKKGSCPAGESAAKEIITIPIYNKIKQKDIEKTIALLGEVNNKGAIIDQKAAGGKSIFSNNDSNS